MKKKIYFINDGCNSHDDSFRQIAECVKDEYDATKELSEADVIIHFTCGFTKTYANLNFFKGSLAHVYKKKKEGAITIITGCGIKMYRREIFDKMENTYVVELPNFVEEICKILQANYKKGEFYVEDSPGILKLDIVMGCLKRGGFCNFCKFHYLDIPFKSLYTIEEVVDIVSRYKVKILVITGPNSTSYGLDFGDHTPQLHRLIQEVSKIPTLKGIAVTSVASSGIYLQLLKELASNEKVYLVNYFFQSGSQTMLDIMNIGSSIEIHEAVIKALKDKAISTAFLMSHPYEGEVELQETLAFIEKHNLWYADVIPFICSDDTPSSLMEQLPEKEYWRHYKLTEHSISKLKHKMLDSLVGKKVKVIIDNSIINGKNLNAQCFGMNARCEIKDTGKHQIGDIIYITVKSVKDYDNRLLIGEECMDFIDAIIEYAKQSPYLGDEIDINVLMREYQDTTPFMTLTLRKVKANCEDFFSKTYFEWKDSRNPDILEFFTHKAEELRNTGDVEHAKVIMLLLKERLEDPENSYIRELETERLRDNIIIMCEERKNFVHQISWPQRKEDIVNLLKEFGWLKTDCSRYKNPMTRTKKPKILKKRRKLVNASFYWNPFYDMWATLAENTLFID